MPTKAQKDKTASTPPAPPFLPPPSRLPFFFFGLLFGKFSFIAYFGLLTFLSLLSPLGSPVAPLAFLYFILHLAHIPAGLIPTTPAKTRLPSTKMHFSTAFRLVVVLLVSLVVSAVPLKRATDPATLQVLSE